MTQVTLWSREHAVGVPGAIVGSEAVAVTYSTMLIPPRSVLLPIGNYRKAASNELVPNPRLLFYPKDQVANEAELKAIREDMDKVAASAPPTLEVP